MKTFLLFIRSLLFSLIFLFSYQSFAALPKLKIIDEENGLSRLYVNNSPFVILGGELLNSSGSTAFDMSKKWEAFKALNLNTILIAVAWEQIEKEEGVFNFSELKNIIKQAKANDMKLVLLWFGAWKNGSSGYVPHWVMRDTKRFPRMKNKNGEHLPYLSNLSNSVLEADKKALLSLMNFLKKEDLQGETVIMIQVENEVGLLGDSRDRSEVAELAFNSKVPDELIKFLNQNPSQSEVSKAFKNSKKSSGTWAEIFGQEKMLADEMFMAWNYAKYIDTLIIAAKKVHNIPMYVNAWTISPDNPPPGGAYPSGGPNYRMMEVWRAASKNIDLFAPDNYQKEYAKKLRDFQRLQNPIFVPEACALWENDFKSASAKAFYTIGEFGAIGFSPFAIDHKTYSANHSLCKAYGVLKNIMPEIGKAVAGKNMHGFMRQKDAAQNFDFGDIVVGVHYNFPYDGYGIIIRLSEEEFLVAATGVDVHFHPKNPNKQVNYGLIQEGKFANNSWKTEKYLGGDEAHGGVGGLHLPPVYLKEDANDSIISTVKVRVFLVDKFSN